MNNFIIVTGHGGYASGISSFIKMIAGNIQGIEYIDFCENCSSERLQEIYQRRIQYHKDKNILFICDILGGTPFKEAVKCATLSPMVEVVVGSSPMAILEASFLKDSLSMQDLINHIISNTKSGVIWFQETVENHSFDEKENSFESGI